MAFFFVFSYVGCPGGPTPFKKIGGPLVTKMVRKSSAHSCLVAQYIPLHYILGVFLSNSTSPHRILLSGVLVEDAMYESRIHS